jgi:hypothetical protein
MSKTRLFLFGPQNVHMMVLKAILNSSLILHFHVATLMARNLPRFNRRLAIRVARFGPEAECLPWEVGEKPTAREFHSLKKKRGAIEGPIRIPLDSSLFLFNALAFPRIPSKSFKLRPVLFSIFTTRECADNAKGCQPAFRVVHRNRFSTLRFVGTT